MLRPVTAIVAATLLVWGGLGCGGGRQGGAPPAPVVTKPKPRSKSLKAGPAEKAAKLYAKLEKDLENLKDGKPIDSAWLRAALEAVLDLDPQHSAARFNMGVVAESNGDAAGARKIYESVMRDDPSFLPAAENVAAIQVEHGNVDYAVSVYRSAISADPKNLTSRLGLARILQTRGKHQEAIELCRKVLQRKADAIEAFRILAESYQAIGDTSMAELIIGRGLRVDDKDIHLHYLTARILLDRNDLAAGVDKLKQVIKMKPDWLKVRAELANIALSYQDFGNAAQQFEAILKKAPNDRPAKLGLAVAYRGLGRKDQAKETYEGLLASNGSDADAMWNFAFLKYRDLHDYDGAIALLVKFKRVAPSGDKDVARADKIVARINKLKKDTAARKAREERERKRHAAIDAACVAIAAGKKPKAEDIGNDQERIQAAWDLLLVKAVPAIRSGEVDAGMASAKCALGLVPTTPGAGATACGQLRIQWVQIQDQLGLLANSTDLKRALETIREAVECDPENPDGQLFEQQLEDYLKQAEEAEAGDAGHARGEMPGGTPDAAVR